MLQFAPPKDSPLWVVRSLKFFEIVIDAFFVDLAYAIFAFKFNLHPIGLLTWIVVIFALIAVVKRITRAVKAVLV